MLQEAKDLQNSAVTKLVNVLTEEKKEFTFKAPTGSGKTYMMADFMNRIIAKNEDIVFIVSTLSKSNLAEQNYKSFKDLSDNGIFPNLNPYLINSDSSGEASIFIPTDHNVYVLPRDLYKDTAKLKKEGTFLNFLQTM
ncbi:MAG: DEAD/DEAH box helicase family protein, partial [Elusimicrobia bacterium]|nr:DEAD/DEAH box helicase family protein [Elusimicrobiota bacterium]